MTKRIRIYGERRPEPDWPKFVRALVLLAEELAAKEAEQQTKLKPERKEDRR
jgi:hypothetical protein